MEKKAREIRELQEIIDYRTRIENQAIDLISQCRFEEALALLDSLEDVV